MKKYLKLLFYLILLFLLFYVPITKTPFDASWYEELSKPKTFSLEFNWLRIGWLTFWILALLSGVIMILSRKSKSKRFFIILLFLNYLFNVMYVQLFFKTKDLILTTVDIFLMVITSYMLFLTGKSLNNKLRYIFILVTLWGILLAFMHVGILKYN